MGRSCWVTVAMATGGLLVGWAWGAYVGMQFGGNHLTRIALFGLRGYELGGAVGSTLGALGGCGLGITIARRVLSRGRGGP